eukprot:768819-Hanusia_phi.AAC.1
MGVEEEWSGEKTKGGGRRRRHCQEECKSRGCGYCRRGERRGGKEGEVEYGDVNVRNDFTGPASQSGGGDSSQSFSPPPSLLSLVSFHRLSFIPPPLLQP